MAPPSLDRGTVLRSSSYMVPHIDVLPFLAGDLAILAAAP